MANAFRLEELDGKIGLVTFDLPDKKVNTLSQRGPARSWRAWSASSNSGPTCAGCCSRAASRASSSPAPI